MEGPHQSSFHHLKSTFHARYRPDRSNLPDPTRYLSHWWRHQVGYGVGVFLVGLGFTGNLLLADGQFSFFLSGILLLSTILVVALLWGMGPAVFTILLSLVALASFATPDGPAWTSALPVLAFALVSVGMATFIDRYKAAFWRLLSQERERLVQEREMAVRATNLRMGTLLTATSQELKTSLIVIEGNLYLCEQKLKRFMEREALYPVTTREFISLLAHLEQARQQVKVEQGLHGLGDDLLDLAHMHTGQYALKMVPCNLVAIVREAVERQQRVAFAQTMRLIMPPEHAVVVLADADRLGQVMTKSLNNILRDSPAECPLEIRLHIEGAFAQVSVCEQEKGDAFEAYDSLWETFSRMQNTPTFWGETVGSEVRWDVCRNIVERHHGQVGLPSAADRSSIFWFTLPLLKEDLCV